MHDYNKRGQAMYGPSLPYSDHLHATKYRGDNESFDDYCIRYARTTSDDEQHFRHLLDALRHQRILPAGRQQLAVGRPYDITAMNCYVGGTIPDTSEGIMDELKYSMLTLRSGGGCGWDFSTLRPHGDPIRGLGIKAYSTGPVSFMGCWDAMCLTVLSAGHRRGAMMGVLRVDHPDIMRFINAKQNQKTLANFNISVAVTNEFMDALSNDTTYPLTFGGRTYDKVHAVDVWARIMERNWDWAEPGVLFIDRINKMNPLYYCEQIAATNPCFTKDTEVWTIDGPVMFGDLAKSGKDVLVLTQDDNNKLTYRTMRNPRCTKKNAQIVRISFNRGEKVYCTPNHRFYHKDGSYTEARHLEQGDRIRSVYRYKANQKGYIRLSNGDHTPLEHHVPFGFIPDDKVVHHINGVKCDNRTVNLQLVDAYVHRSSHMMGKNNPSVRFPERNWLTKQDWSGKNNGRYRDDIDDAKLIDLRSKGLSYLEIAEKAGCSKYTVMKRLGWNRPVNHIVTEVKWMTKREDVYCGTVDEFGKFFIANGENEGLLVSNCGEQPLPPHGACLLGSLNIVKYLGNKYLVKHSKLSGTEDRIAKLGNGYSIDYDLLALDTAVACRAFDNVIDCTRYPLERQREEQQNKRRMGIGVTGMANALEIMGFPYASEQYLAEQERILACIRDTAYNTSISAAKRLGSFPLFDSKKWLASGFAKTLPGKIRSRIRKEGLRNGLLLSIAPTGTISMCADNISSGIEPPYQITGKRLVHMSEGQVEVNLEDFASRNYGVKGLTASEVSAEAHIRVLCSAQKYVDSAVSKTCNVKGAIKGQKVDGEVLFEDFKKLYWQAYEGGAKGCTTFNMNGKRFGIFLPEESDADGVGCTINPETGARTCEI